MPRHGDSPRVAAASREDNQRAEPRVARGGGEVRALDLAREFLSTLRDARAPWPPHFEPWARERGLSIAETREVRVAILRVRCFGADERHGAQP